MIVRSGGRLQVTAAFVLQLPGFKIFMPAMKYDHTQKCMVLVWYEMKAECWYVKVMSKFQKNIHVVTLLSIVACLHCYTSKVETGTSFVVS